jgi:hypothetical protein
MSRINQSKLIAPLSAFSMALLVGLWVKHQIKVNRIKYELQMEQVVESQRKHKEVNKE